MKSLEKANLICAASIILIVVCASPGLRAGQSAQFTNPQEAFRVGQRELQAGRYLEAESAFREVLRLDPQSAAAYSNLGVVYMRLARFDAAIEAFEQAARRAPRVAGIYLNLGLAFQHQSRFREAIPHFQRALELGADPARTRYLLGFMQYLSDDFEAAAQTLEPIYPQFSSRIEYLFILGSCYGKTGREDRAAEVFTRMMQVGGDSPRIHWLMGNAYLTAQVNHKAIEELEKAQADPNLPYVHYSLALAYYRAKRLDEARQALEKEIRLNPDFASAHGLLGSVYLDLRELDAALASYHRSLQLRPEQAAAFYGLGRVHLLKGEIPEAVKYLEKAAQLKPDDDSVQFQLGQAYLKAGRQEEGKKALARARQLQIEERDMLERKVLGEMPPSPVQPEIAGEAR